MARWQSWSIASVLKTDESLQVPWVRIPLSPLNLKSLLNSVEECKNYLMSKVYDWFEERLEVQAIADDISSKYVPPHVNFFIVLVVLFLLVF